MNSRSKRITVIIGATLLLAHGASSVRADSVQAGRFSEELNRGQQIKIELSNLSQQEAVAYLESEHLNNGKHLGFSLTSKHHGPKLSVLGYYDQAAVTPNPEPVTIVLFGTGLIGLGAYARRKYHG